MSRIDWPLPPTAGSRSLASVIADCAPAAVAVSGGVDSMTLACFAQRQSGHSMIRVVHAVSPAVPAAATQRVKALAAQEGWSLEILDAGEFGDERYRANPVNRCFFCKSNLYETLGDFSTGTVLSGTNCNDLRDYRPGLKAAENNGVRHPFVEAGMAKEDVRALARRLGLGSIAELPASPCLSSRVETGIRIEADMLAMIDQVEEWLRTRTSADTIRCRVRKAGLVIELDREAAQSMSHLQKDLLAQDIQNRFPETKHKSITIRAYQRGSAFVGARKVTPL